MYLCILVVMKLGLMFGLFYGFLFGVMNFEGAKFRDDINVVFVASKGMGLFVCWLYE